LIERKSSLTKEKRKVAVVIIPQTNRFVRRKKWSVITAG